MEETTYPDAPPAVDPESGIAAPVVTTPEDAENASVTVTVDTDGDGTPDLSGTVDLEPTGESESEPEAEAEQKAAEPAEPRRPRGWLELDIERLLKAVNAGEISPADVLGRPIDHLTPHFVAETLAKVESLPKKPSTGAVAAVFNRWADLGVATFSDKPYGFIDFTDEAKALGIAAIKARRKAEAAPEPTEQAEQAAEGAPSGEVPEGY